MAEGADIAADQASDGVDTPLEDWPQRPWILAGLLGFAGLLIHFCVSDSGSEALKAALAAFAFFGSLGAAFTIGPNRLREPAIFAGIAGAVMAGLAWHAVSAREIAASEEFAFAAGVFAIIIALPMFQAGFHKTRLATDYKLTHFHVWSDAVSAAGALAFTGLSWLLLFMLDGLLGLVGIDIIDALMDEEWFGWVWSSSAFGAALGVLRNNLKVIGALQNVVMIVLSLLAIPLALALTVFLLGLLASGGQALWDATDDATPILLACAVGCFILSNAIFRDDDEARSSNKVMQVAAAVLAAGILPLAIFAAISLGIRINQYGLAPERIWALLAVMIAAAYGVAYWAGLIRGRRKGWAGSLRRANLHLAAFTCCLALFLALPILDFGGISANNQLGRLEAGDVTAEEFDYTALRWDFGDAGRRALDELAAGAGEVAGLAADARDEEIRPSSWERDQRARELDFRVQSDDPEFELAVREFLEEAPWRCAGFCVAIDMGTNSAGLREAVLVRNYDFVRVQLGGDAQDAVVVGEAAYVMPPLTEESTVEIREFTRRYVVIDGVPMALALDNEPAGATQEAGATAD